MTSDAPRQRATTAEFGGARGTVPPAAPPTTDPPAPLVADYLTIEPDGSVTARSGKAEVGQNVRTSLAQAVADELRLPVERVRVVLADTASVPFDRGTFGSRSTPDMAVRLRAAAATAREALIEAAAERWESDTSALAVRDGVVVHAETGQALGFGELATRGLLDRPVADQSPVNPAESWLAAGVSVPKVDGQAMVTGEHRYASDVSRPGMLFGKVLRAPAFGARLAAVDVDMARGLPGVTVVREGEFVGVAALSASAARQALAALRPTWGPPAEVPSEDDLFDQLEREAGGDDGARQLAERTRFEEGSLEEGYAQAQHVLRARYSVAYIAHAPLEPRAAVAEWDGDRLTVWTGTQRPFGVQAELMAAFDLPAERAHVIVPDTGAGYGGKHTGEAALEAARLARAVGRPVKVAWTREEEFTWAYFRPAGLMLLGGGVRADGTLTAWEHRTHNAGGSALRTPYDVPHQHSEFVPARAPLRQGSYRALAATANTFARECFLDELAHAAGVEPLALRRRSLPAGRLRDALEAAAERFGWERYRSAPGRGAGLACGTEKGGYVGTCVEVEVDPASGEARVLRIVAAFECGAVVNPDHLRNQVEGALVQGLGGALSEAVHFGDGRILNPRFSEYRVPRFADVPDIDVVLLDRKDLPSAGAGEAPIIAVAAAIGNAIFAATGERRRSMPLNR